MNLTKEYETKLNQKKCLKKPTNVPNCGLMVLLHSLCLHLILFIGDMKLIINTGKIKGDRSDKHVQTNTVAHYKPSLAT